MQGKQSWLSVVVGISITSSLLMSLVLTLFSYQYIHMPNSTFQSGASTIIVKKGQDFDDVLSALNKIAPIAHPQLLRLYARLRGIGHSIHIGEYQFIQQESWYEVLNKLSNGTTYQRRFTVVEGWNIYQVLAALQADTHIEHTIDYTQDPIVANLPSLYHHPEGAYLPDTYYYTYPTTDRDILVRARNAMQHALESLVTNEQCLYSERSVYDMLIIASLLEKEAVDRDEMAIIAGVIDNRLIKRMHLGIDAAVRYGVKNFNAPLLQSELQANTPYNTYKQRGLPPTPIANPSQMALFAACKPVQTDYLYYVSMDGKRHHFSKTLKEHHQAVHKYLR